MDQIRWPLGSSVASFGLRVLLVTHHSPACSQTPLCHLPPLQGGGVAALGAQTTPPSLAEAPQGQGAEWCLARLENRAACWEGWLWAGARLPAPCSVGS